MTATATMLPRRYDFNEHFDPLPVLNQGQSPTCVLQTRATLTNAFMRMRRARATRWDVGDVSWSDSGPCDFLADTPRGQLTVHNHSGCMPGREHYWPTTPEGEEVQTPDAIRRALLLNGIAEIGVPGRSRAFGRAWGATRVGKRWRLPVLDYAPAGPSIIDHDITAVGYTPRGVIVQNSWGLAWGKNGRVVLTWAFLAGYGCRLLVYTFADYPADSLVLPPRR